MVAAAAAARAVAEQHPDLMRRPKTKTETIEEEGLKIFFYFWKSFPKLFVCEDQLEDPK
jgi:hypothetical protein